jgi:hypothetical protein
VLFALFVFIVGFNLFMTGWLKEWSLFFTGLPLALAILLVSWRVLSKGGFLEPYLAVPAVSEGSV